MIRIGKIVAARGLKGSLVMTHVAGASTWLKKGHTLMIEMQKGSYIPFFVTSVKPDNTKEYTVTLEDIESLEAAKKLVTKQVYTEEALLSAFAKESPLLWIDFKVVDGEKGELGNIKDVTNTGFQWLAAISYRDKEVLIPMTEQVVTGVDINKKTVTIKLPEGLLEVYLGA